MKALPRAFALSGLVLLAACRTAVATFPTSNDPDVRVVLGFFDRYNHRDLEGMMGYLDEGAHFQGSGTSLDKAQIRAFFQDSFRRHPNLRLEVSPPQWVRHTLQVRVRLETDVISVSTWAMVMKDHKILTYSVTPGTP